MSEQRDQNQVLKRARFSGVPAQRGEKVTTMAIQKKSLIGKRQTVKKALVAKRVSADTPKADQVKAPFTSLTHRTALRIAGPVHSASTVKFLTRLN